MLGPVMDQVDFSPIDSECLRCHAQASMRVPGSLLELPRGARSEVRGRREEHRGRTVRADDARHPERRRTQRRLTVRTRVRAVTALTFLGVAAVHVAWGRGSSFPFPTHADLNDAVVGRDVTPSPPACFAVATLLTGAALLASGAPIGPPRLRRLGIAAVVGVLTVRGASGLAGRTDALVPGSTSARFRRNDRRYFAPLCLALAAGSATAFAS